MADHARMTRGDSTGSEEEEHLSPVEFVERQMEKMRSLGEREDLSFLESAPSHCESSHSGNSSMSVYEKLQALALAENIKLDDPSTSRGSLANHEDDKQETHVQDAREHEEDDDDDDDCYEISWDGGPLGLLFKANANGQPVIRRVNKKGAATGLQYARPGDVLLALNGVSVSATPFSAIIEQLKHPEFPVKLDFRPLKLSDLASAASAASTKWGLPRTGSIHSSDAASAFCGSPVSSNATVDLRNYRGGGWNDSSPRSMPPMTEQDPADVEYDVVWSEGPLGCELKQRNGLPAVKSVTGTGVTPSVAQIAMGDILVSINGLRTDEIGFKSTVTLMMRATKPVYLRFLRGGARQSLSTGYNVSDLPPGGYQGTPHRAPMQEPSTLESKQYMVLWRDGPLGIQIRTSSKGRVVVARLTGAGAPNVNELVKPGDYFVRIAGVDVDSLGIAGAFELLKTAAKPVVLVFQRRGRGRHRSQSRHRHAVQPSPAPLPLSSGLPSFRQLREEEAAAGRSPIKRSYSNGHLTSRQRNKSHGGSTKNMDALFANEFDTSAASDDAMSQHSYDYLGDSPRSNASHPYPGLVNVDGSASENGLPGYAEAPARPPFSGTYGPPERGNAEETEHPEEDTFSPERPGNDGPSLTGLPPPPSYMDVFTASGRAKDDLMVVPASSRSLTRQSLYVDESTAGKDQYSGHVERPPPFEAHLVPPAPQYAQPAAPPPPEETPSLVGQPSRLQELRRQYIESERQRNLLQNGHATMVSTYSDIDDSGLVVRRPKPFFDQSSVSASGGPSPQLPLPELWVRWSEGPLGITFKRKNGQIVVSRLTGSGYSAGLTQLRPGDWLVSFNNQSTSNLRLGETMELLKRSPKPVDMCFIVQ
ncbi:hypothetical protein PsorP6_000888 [Peronosclerospora sorghi]|uniref:Uncharacterized protein n=1 Tax=Peronosclerospora sorghi TaxID=230839 RepID=A0ACC0WS79_9STRA|nr:hypothetical protein PsorP6_000888 [Peronosclerospora sorghi]